MSNISSWTVAVGLLACAGAGGIAQAATPASEAELADPTLTDIIVTARRREEKLQSVPVSVTALDAVALERSSIKDLSDLTRMAPGLRFAAEGTLGSANLTIRGLSKVPTGQPVSAVALYFAEIPLRSDGAILPTFDLAGIQVFKGPQGTLFGRNSIGGAVLISPVRPDYDLDGYLKVQVGSYSQRIVEGAITIPLIDDVFSIRLAAQIQRRHGYTENVNAGPDFDEVHNHSFRVSTLFQPTDWLTNHFVFDYFKANEAGPSYIAIRVNPGILPIPGIDAQLAAILAQQKQMGPRKAFNAVADNFLDRSVWGLSNITEIDAGTFTIRNIFGYRSTFMYNAGNNDGLPPLFGGAISLIKPSSRVEAETYSDELQVLGDAFDGKLDWIVGGQYLKDQPKGPNGDATMVFNIFGSAPRQAVSTYQTDTTKALFAQVGITLLEGLKANLGYRHTWAKSTLCTSVRRPPTTIAGYHSEAECNQLATVSPIDGQGTLATKSDAPTWTIGLDYQATPDVFLYAVSRRGFRQGGITAPVFESPNTTGDPDGAGPIRGLDLRPYQYYRPEKLTDFEVGAKSRFAIGGWRQQVNAAAYTSKYKNSVQSYSVAGFLTADGGTPVRSALGINGADFTIKGLELDAVVAPSRSLQFSLSGAYTDAKVDRVTPVGQFPTPPITLPTPKLSYTVAAQWTAPGTVVGGELSVRADYFWTEHYQAQGTRLPGYELVNARIALDDIAGAGFDLAIFARNLFDEEYPFVPIVLRPNVPVNSVSFGEPRTIGLELRCRFGK